MGSGLPRAGSEALGWIGGGEGCSGTDWGGWEVLVGEGWVRVGIVRTKGREVKCVGRVVERQEGLG